MGKEQIQPDGKKQVSQNEILKKNIEAVAEVQRKHKRSRTAQDRLADLMTAFSGSMAFVYVHMVWFGTWIILNTGIVYIPRISAFDPFPFPLLTLVVSLEAIFLSTFVLISQNRSAELSERRAELDLHVNLLAEQKTAKVLDLLHQVAGQLDQMHEDFNIQRDPETEALKVSPEPQEVLEVIEKTVKEEVGGVKGVKDAVKEITGEVEAVHTKVKETSGQLREVSAEVKEIKQEMKSKDEG